MFQSAQCWRCTIQAVCTLMCVCILNCWYLHFIFHSLTIFKHEHLFCCYIFWLVSSCPVLTGVQITVICVLNLFVWLHTLSKLVENKPYNDHWLVNTSEKENNRVMNMHNDYVSLAFILHLLISIYTNLYMYWFNYESRTYSLQIFHVINILRLRFLLKKLQLILFCIFFIKWVGETIY